MARESHALSPEIYTIEESRQIHGDSGNSTICAPSHQPSAPTGKGKKQREKKSQGSGSSSPSRRAFNSSDSYNEAERRGRRLEAALRRRSMEAVKANSDALWARFQEECKTGEIAVGLPGVGQQNIEPTGEIVCASLRLQLLGKSSTIPEASGKLALQQFESMHLPLSLALRVWTLSNGDSNITISSLRQLQDAINSASSVTRTLSGELADGQRKLLALAVSGSNSKTANPLVSHVSSGPLSHEKVLSNPNNDLMLQKKII
ncbi:hypothetical protein HAX54_046521 [Datura stramonium]|uniref:Uncharacterized protein n=1 Tax=Datura stramonium TaxID=4076 RepID=A0ABS8WKT8_DATST|nr:hypothetical protein [Datura stramonium]